MISIKDLVETCRAIELLSYGVDISKLDGLKQYWNSKENKLQSKVSPNIVHDACVVLDTSVSEFLQWPIGTYFIRHDTEWFTVFEESLTDEEKALKKIVVDLDTFKGVMKVLRIKSFATYSDIDVNTYYPEFYEELAKERAKFDCTDVTECELIDKLTLQKTRQNLIAMLMCSEYEDKVAKAVLKAFDNPDEDFEIPALKSFKVIDNRLYIRVPDMDREEFKSNVSSDLTADKIKYIVISRNPYDFYFCSYGSNIQSCYSINSTNFGWYGAVAMSPIKGYYMIYGTDGKCNDINIINGKKWSVPRMFFRAWGWLASNGNLMVDRIYPDGSWRLPDRNDVLNFLSPFLGYDCMNCKKSMSMKLKYGKELATWYDEHKCHMYPDSVNIGRATDDEIVYRGICYGTRNFVGHCSLSNDLLYIMHRISSIADGLEYNKDYTILNGVLSTLRRCPITDLPILPTETKSFFAKFFKEKIDGPLLVGTFCDGYFKMDTCTYLKSSPTCATIMSSNANGTSVKDGNCYYFYPRFSNTSIPIKVFKEQMTGYVKSSPFAYVIIRYIEDDRVTFVKYKGK